MTILRSVAVLAAAAGLLAMPARLEPLAAQGRAQATFPAPGNEGRDLFVARCASCHGADGSGAEDGPSLLETGPAMTDFQLRTGRMPLADPSVQPRRKPAVFDEAEMAAIVSHVDSLSSGGAGIPEVDPAAGDLSLGQQLFVSQCAPCHGAVGTGGAVGKGALAPSLSLAAPLEVAEAMLVGPGEMPVFSFTPHERDSILAFLEDLAHRPDRGGADIGGIGPVPEGFVAWVLGMGSILAIVLLVGHRRQRPPGERT